MLSVSARDNCVGGVDSAPWRRAVSDRKWGVRCDGGEQKRAGFGDGEGMSVDEEMRERRSSSVLRTLARSPPLFSFSDPPPLSPFSFSFSFSPLSLSPLRTMSAMREAEGVAERGGGRMGRV